MKLDHFDLYYAPFLATVIPTLPTLDVIGLIPTLTLVGKRSDVQIAMLPLGRVAFPVTTIAFFVFISPSYYFRVV